MKFTESSQCNNGQFFAVNRKKQILYIAMLVCICALGIVVAALGITFMRELSSFHYNNPSLLLPAYINIVNLIALFASCAILILAVVLLLTLKKRRYATGVSLVLLIIIFSLFFSSIACQASFDKFAIKNHARSTLRIIDNDYFAKITLHEFKNALTDPAVAESIIYVGRNDCEKCAVFENKMESYLEKQAYRMTTYCTDSDRDGANSGAMYRLLDRHNISTVPTVIVSKAGTVIKMWSDPVADVDEIKTYMKELIKQNS